jgi:ATP-binding cassette subfamily G (WHITE) protein 1
MSILNTEKQNNKKSGGSVEKVHVDSDKERIASLLAAWETSSQSQRMIEIVKTDTASSDDKTPLPVTKFRASFWTQFQFLFGRAGRNAWRNKFIVRINFFQAMFVGLLVGLIYYDTASKAFDQQVQNFSGSLFFISVNQVFSAIGVLNVFASEKAVFSREYSNGYYSLAAYFWSKTLVESPVRCVPSFTYDGSLKSCFRFCKQWSCIGWLDTQWRIGTRCPCLP